MSSFCNFFSDRLQTKWNKSHYSISFQDKKIMSLCIAWTRRIIFVAASPRARLWNATPTSKIRSSLVMRLLEWCWHRMGNSREEFKTCRNGSDGDGVGVREADESVRGNSWPNTDAICVRIHSGLGTRRRRNRRDRKFRSRGLRSGLEIRAQSPIQPWTTSPWPARAARPSALQPVGGEPLTCLLLFIERRMAEGDSNEQWSTYVVNRHGCKVSTVEEGQFGLGRPEGSGDREKAGLAFSSSIFRWFSFRPTTKARYRHPL